MKEEVLGSGKVVAYLYEVKDGPYSPAEHCLYLTIIREKDIPDFNRARTSAIESAPGSKGIIDILVEDISDAGDFVRKLGIEPLTWVEAAHIPSYEGEGEKCRAVEGIRFAEFIYDASQRPEVVGALKRCAGSLGQEP